MTSTWRSRLSSGPIAFILGNEGGDCDSVVCAYMLGRLLDTAHRTPFVAAGRLASVAPWLKRFAMHTPVALCNFPAADLVLRGDITLAFKRAELSAALQMASSNNSSSSVASAAFSRDASAMMLFADQIPLLSDPASVKDLQPDDCVLLVDHNIPTASQMHLAPFVRGIVDHHALANEPIKIPRPAGASPDDNSVLEVIETIGSAASIVTRLYRQLQLPLDPFQARLLLAPVLLDTNNFNASSKKAVEGDFSARDFLCRVISAYSYGPQFNDESMKHFFKELMDEREAYDTLSIAEALRKDAKTFHFETPLLARAAPSGDAASSAKPRSSPPSLVLPISSWGENLTHHVLPRFSMAALLTELRASSAKADGAIAMFHKKGERHVVFFARTEPCARALRDIFVLNKAGVAFRDLTAELVGAEVAAAAVAGGGGVAVGAVIFEDHTISRKNLTPKIQEFCNAWQ